MAVKYKDKRIDEALELVLRKPDNSLKENIAEVKKALKDLFKNNDVRKSFKESVKEWVEYYIENYNKKQETNEEKTILVETPEGMVEKALPGRYLVFFLFLPKYSSSSKEVSFLHELEKKYGQNAVDEALKKMASRVVYKVALEEQRKQKK
ncbi:MAG: hypothetical protein QXF82_09160 [Nitrososphaeria archaeon]